MPHFLIYRIDGWPARGFPRQILAYVGSRSFALYLAHNPVFWAAKEVAHRVGALNAGDEPTNPTLYATLSLLAMVILAELSYRLVEVPFRDWGRALTKRVPSTKKFTLAAAD